MQSYAGVDFVSKEAAASLLCTLCGLVLCEPMVTDNYDDDVGLAPCDHIFCQRCIEKHLETASYCPYKDCHRPLTNGQIFAELATQNKVGSLEVRCSKCGWIGLLGEKGSFLLEHRAACSSGSSSQNANEEQTHLPVSSSSSLAPSSSSSISSPDVKPHTGDSSFLHAPSPSLFAMSSPPISPPFPPSSWSDTELKADTEDEEVLAAVVHVQNNNNNASPSAASGGNYLFGAGGGLEQKRQAWRAQAATVQPKGHPREYFTFQDDFMKQFICQLCQGVFRDAMVVDNFTSNSAPCNHCFCQACLVDWLSINKTCPTCDRPADPSQIYAELLLRRRVWDLKVRCKFHDRGCGWEGILGKEGAILQEHMAKCRGRPEVEELEDSVGTSELAPPPQQLPTAARTQAHLEEVPQLEKPSQQEDQDATTLANKAEQEIEEARKKQEELDLLVSPTPDTPDSAPTTPAIPDFFDPRVVNVEEFMKNLMTKSVRSSAGGQSVEDYVKGMLDEGKEAAEQEEAQKLSEQDASHDLPPLVSITAPPSSVVDPPIINNASTSATSATTTATSLTSTSTTATVQTPTTSSATPSTSATDTTSLPTLASTVTNSADIISSPQVLSDAASVSQSLVLPRPSSPSLAPITPPIPEIATPALPLTSAATATSTAITDATTTSDSDRSDVTSGLLSQTTSSSISTTSTASTTSSTVTQTQTMSASVPATTTISPAATTATSPSLATTASTQLTTLPSSSPSSSDSSSSLSDSSQAPSLSSTDHTSSTTTSSETVDPLAHALIPLDDVETKEVIEVSTSELEVLPDPVVPVLKCKWPICTATFTCQAESDIHSTVCPHRLIMCPLCGKSNSLATATDHPKICPMSMVGCPNHCQGGETLRRKDVQAHVATQCQEVEEPCAYKAQGCLTMIRRKHAVAHVQTEASAHLALVTKVMLAQHEAITALSARLETLETKSKQRETAPDWLNEMVTCTRIGCGLRAARKDVPKTRCSWHTAPPSTVSVMRCKKSFGCKADFNRCFVYPCCGYCKACMEGCQTGVHEIAEVRPPPS